MSAATASQIQFEGVPAPHPFDQLAALVPTGRAVCRRSRAEDSRRLFRTGLCASLGVHVGVLIAGWLVMNSYFPPKEEVVLPQAPALFDVSIVPLSALETVLPQGAPAEKPAEAPPIPKQEAPPQPPKEKPQPPEVVVPKRKVEKAKPARENPERKTPAESQPASLAPVREGTDAPTTNQQPGFVNGKGSSNEKARLNYQEAVAMLLARSKRYPERALRRGLTGEATIRIEIKSDGSLAGFEILRSAGASVLDEELRAMVDRASPFPRFPGDLNRQSLALVVPVAFTIK